MAHFVELDSNDVVLRSVVVSNEDIKDVNGEEQESIGIELCKTLFGSDTTWVQTSRNANFRKVFGQVGFRYHREKDMFYDPKCPYKTWYLDDNLEWQPPIPLPENASVWCYWDEETNTWVDPE